jgi:hypothetical protein
MPLLLTTPGTSNPAAIVVPRARRYIRARHRSFRLTRALRSLKRQPRGSSRTWQDLVYGWGNEDFSARPTYLDAVAAAALTQDGPILECGSGITTLLLATVARHTGSSVWSFENDSASFRSVQAALDRFGLTAHVLLAPLRDYGAFDWYDVQPTELPQFSLVVCDGPPGSTRGGRYGLVPVLSDRLASGCTILLEDAGRSSEREVLHRWMTEAHVRYSIRGGDDPYAVITLK